MKKRHYKWFSAFYRLNDKIERKFTMTGQALVLCAFALIFFGLNTRVSMLFAVFAVSIALLLTDALSLMFIRSDFEFERFLPECVPIGKNMTYPVILREKGGKNSSANLFYTEVPAAPIPDFEVFDATKEPGEEKRNAFDRKMGYYRWKWLITKNLGGKYAEFAVTGRKSGGGIMFEASFLPDRRGKISFGGAYIFQKGIFGLLKKGKIIPNPGSFLVLPVIKEPFEIPENEGGRTNEKSEKIRETQETGNGFELKALRDFVPGDSIRNIHWKSSAKSGQLRTKEFYKEVDSGSMMFIDNFFPERYSEDFEKILSAAASLLNAMQKDDNLPQILFVGRDSREIPDSSKKSFAGALAMLALAGNDAENTLESCLETLFEAAQSASTIFFFTSRYDRSKEKVMKELAGSGVSLRIFYSGSAESSGELSRYETKIDLQ
ncbi:DUF58 domain-containing protein [bacterium]|nr:DUF58 domain-containing protein [bacterium]